MKNNNENLLMVNYDIVANNYCWIFKKINSIESLMIELNSKNKFDSNIFEDAKKAIEELIAFKKEFAANGLEKSLKSNIISNRQFPEAEFDLENFIEQNFD
ncbi:hypothetical protein [Clostridium perfringens]|uniref:hypothetical protein n=1 Tax=Clostridium perfringens TaxID=1502 RepID=UPI000D70CD3E|nr:hypothetical protein [Clostridium perfringens]PWX20923.1 hypothetical protein CYK64_09465 [Clostridium perfringens]TPG00078.1 hypothetical protein CBI46_09935 [Clostridium perfringens A]